jgi:hypothetical protein
MTKTFSINIFPDVRTRQGRSERLSWDDLVSTLRDHQKTLRKEPGESHDDFKKRQPAFNLCEPGEGTNGRAGKEVVSVTGAVLDMDHMTDEQVPPLMSWLREYNAVVYSTASHTDIKNPRLRIVLPLSEPVPAAEWPGVFAAISAEVERVCGAVPDPASKGAPKLNNMPVTPQDTADKVEPFFAVFDGEFFSPRLRGIVNKSETISTSTEPKKREALATKQSLKSHIKVLEGADPNSKYLPPLRELLAEKPIGTPGNRNQVLLELIAHLVCARFGDCTEASVYDLFRGSIGKAIQDVNDENADNLPAEIKGMIERAYAKIDSGEWTKRSTLTTKLEASGGMQIEPLTHEDLERRAKEAGVPVKEYLQHALIRSEGRFYIRKPHGGYFYHSTSKDDVTSYIRDYVWPQLRKVAPEGDYSFYKESKDGVYLRPVEQIAQQFATTVKEVVFTWCDEHTRVTPQTTSSQGSLRSALKQAPIVEAKYIPHIDAWLRKFAGAQYETLVQWICQAPDMSKPLAALMMEGPRQVGKTAFATAMHHVCGGPNKGVKGAPIDADRWVKSFPEFDKSPIIYADEGVPTKWQGADGLKRIKSFLTNPVVSIDKKYHAPFEVEGYYRLIMAANDRDVFGLKEKAIPLMSQAAIAERILWIQISDEASAYLGTLRHDQLEFQQFTMDIAAHCLHLIETTEVERWGRMGVKTDTREVLQALQVGDAATSILTDWFISLLEKPQILCADKQAASGFIVEKDNLLVSAQVLKDKDVLEYYYEGRRDWTTKYVRDKLHAMSDGNQVRRVDSLGRRRRFHVISMDKLSALTEGDYDDAELVELLYRENGLKDRLENAAKPATVTPINKGSK